MIGQMAVRVTADRANFPLGTLFVRAGSAAIAAAPVLAFSPFDLNAKGRGSHESKQYQSPARPFGHTA